LLAALLLIACTTDQPKKTDAGATDAGPAAVVVDAGAASVDAGSDPVPIPVVTEQVDAGHMGDVKPNNIVVDGHAPVAPDQDLKTKIFNRVIVKPNDKTSAEDVQKLVEDKTGQKLEKVRKTAGTFFLLQFTPTSPPRTKAAQDALIQQLKDTKAFAVVEADQVMTLK
jgi:hypothetical protein